MLSEQRDFIEKLYMRLYSEMILYAQNHLVNPGLAEELVQDTFREAMQKIDVLAAHPNPRGWIIVTLQNKIYNCKREIAKQKEKLLSLDDEMLASVLVSDSAEDLVVEDITYHDAVERIDQTLTKEEKYLLRRFAFDEASHKEIAEELGVSLWVSQKRIIRIRKKVEKLFPNQKKKK